MTGAAAEVTDYVAGRIGEMTVRHEHEPFGVMDDRVGKIDRHVVRSDRVSDSRLAFDPPVGLPGALELLVGVEEHFEVATSVAPTFNPLRDVQSFGLEKLATEMLEEEPFAFEVAPIES